MGWILRDFLCEACSHSFEELVESAGYDTEPCPECGTACRHVISAAKPATYSMMSRDDQAKCLRKRSREHTLKELKRDPTQIKKTRHKLK